VNAIPRGCGPSRPGGVRAARDPHRHPPVRARHVPLEETDRTCATGRAFRRVTRLKSSSMSFWTGVAVRSSMYFFDSPATKTPVQAETVLESMGLVHDDEVPRPGLRRTPMGLALRVSMDAMRNGFRSQSGSTETAKGKANFVSISSRHWPVSAAGDEDEDTMYESSDGVFLEDQSASIVLPRPTSSARIARPRKSRKTRSAVRSWCSYRVTP